MQKTLTYTEFDPASVKYKPLMTNAKGGKTVYTNYCLSNNQEVPCRFQMTEDASFSSFMDVPWGLSYPPDGQPSNGKLSLDVNVRDEKLAAFLSKMDEKNMGKALESCQEWFKKTIEEPVLRDMYVPMLKPAAKEGLPPYARLKIWTDPKRTEVFVMKSEGECHPGTMDDLVKGARVVPIVETTSLWFMSRQFGMSLVTTSILVYKPEASTGLSAFRTSAPISCSPAPAPAPAPEPVEEGEGEEQE